jgi:hypothetical protein
MRKSVKIALAAALAITAGAAGTAAWAHRDGHGGGHHGGGYHGGGYHGGGYHGGGKHGGWGRHHGKHHGGMRSHKMMERYDANKDGKLTQEEINSNREAWLKEFDANNDGKLSLEEFKQLWLKARAERIVRAFQRFDRDGDAGVTLEEYQRPLANIVERMDRNGDGTLSKDDRRSHRKWRQRMRDGMGGGMSGDDAPADTESEGGSDNN